MTKEQIKELLEKQLQLLSEQSHSSVASNMGEIPSCTRAMLEIAEFLKNY